MRFLSSLGNLYRTPLQDLFNLKFNELPTQLGIHETFRSIRNSWNSVGKYVCYRGIHVMFSLWNSSRTFFFLFFSSTDSQLKLWDISKGHCVKSYKGHSNEKNFVGLATNGDYIACGMEFMIWLLLNMSLSDDNSVWNQSSVLLYNEIQGLGYTFDLLISCNNWHYFLYLSSREWK